MTLTNKEAGYIVNVLLSCEEKGKLGYAIARNIRFLKDAAKEYLDRRDAYIQEHGQVNHATGQYRYLQKNVDAALADIVDLEVEFSPCLVDEETFIGGGLNSRQMEAMIWMIKPKEGKKE